METRQTPKTCHKLKDFQPLSAGLSTVFQGCMDHVPSTFGVSVLW
jgi:hypothetical protein